ncbi:MAG: KH domain-containing protein [Luteolibacter sp.]
MPIRISKFTNSLKELGEIQVTELDFMELLNKDIGDLEISRSLKRLGNIRVMEWDFRTVLPAVNKFAHREVDLVDLVRRTAHYKVMDWDFRSALAPEPAESPKDGLSPAEMQGLILRLKNFLQYIVVNLIDEPTRAQIKVQEIAPNVLRFRLVLGKRDAAMLIGRDGQTASAIRGTLKNAALAKGAHALLLIHTPEEEAAHLNGGR